MKDVLITISLAADEDTTAQQVRDFINAAIGAALERMVEDDPATAPRFAYNGEPFESWTTT